MPDKKKLIRDVLHAKIQNARKLEFPEPLDQAVSIISGVEAQNRMWEIGKYPFKPSLEPKEAWEIVEQKLVDMYSRCELEDMLRKELDQNRKKKALELRYQIGRDMDDWRFLKSNNIVLDS